MKAPFYNRRTWARVLAKALLFLLIGDTLIILLRPIDLITPHSLFENIVHARMRLLVDDSDQTDQIMPLETLLNAHEINHPKAPDEFRVVVLGDSGINGWGNSDNETITAYLSAAGLTLQNRKIHAYNLAFVGPSMTRDLVIADAALVYQPDLIVSFVTLWGLRDDQLSEPLLEMNQARMTSLTSQFGLRDHSANVYGHYQDVWWKHSILVAHSTLYRWLRFQAYALYQPNQSGISGPAVQKDLTRQLNLESKPLENMTLPNSTWDSLAALPQISKVPVLIVNEPILIASGSSSSYDAMYPRAAYDRYRIVLGDFCNQHNLWCLDLWDVLPSADFTDDPLHHTPRGNQVIATRIAGELSRVLGANK